MIRVLICDDAAEARTLLRTMLSAHPEMEVVGEAENGGQAVALALELSPDVVVMDVAMPVMNGIEATRRLLELCPTVRVVAFAGSDDEDDVRQMLEAGASAYCVKGAPLWELERSIVGAGLPLVRLAHALARVPSPPGVAQLVARELAELAGAALVATYLGAGAESLTLAGAAGASAVPDLGSAPSEAPALVREAFSSLEPQQGGPIDAAETLRLFGTPSGELLAVPLVADGEALGALLVAMPANVLFTADPELVRAAADLAAAALASTRRHALTYAEARTDALTGLPNRRSFDEYLDDLLEQAGRRGPVSLALIDLDDFKQVNDRRGHGEGDRVLRTVARVLLRTTRADEEVFRVGGDEFALLVRGDEVAVSQALERFRQELSRQRRANGLPTLSAGIAHVARRGVAREELLEEADRALYAAKGAGKNRVVSSGASAGGKRHKRQVGAGASEPPASGEQGRLTFEGRPLRVLIVDDDPGLRMLLRTTFEIIDIEVEEADSIETAEARLAAHLPDVLVLDVALPGRNGLEFCRRLRQDEAMARLPVVLLTGLGEVTESDAESAGANALLRKPFSPLELLSTIERLAGGLSEGPFQLGAEARSSEQLILYAQDLRRLLEIERSQRMLLQKAYEETAGALAAALESKDFGTSAHSQRVRRYALELARALDSTLLDDPSLEYGFLLHDVGKIGVPDRILLKRGALTAAERRVMQTHAVVGEQMLRSVPLLQEEGLHVIRSHHERWDGAGYPDALAGEAIAVGARVFSVADALDAITSERPYRAARSWEEARREIEREAEHQFDPTVVAAFGRCERRLRRIYYELRAA
jgi:diguanylate cyclase (GGDEF)-like protein